MKRVLITGGAGFIGINTAKFFIDKGYDITILDNLSREGVENNLDFLKKEYKGKFKFIKGDVVNFNDVKKSVRSADIVIHLAGQVAVTTSVINPRFDFETNAIGTLNVLESLRQTNPKAILLYSSTNKVYGGMENEKVVENKSGYAYKSLKQGIPEIYPLDFHSPYGCSKGAADQYVRDYARIYKLNTIVFRQSCIYGPHQMGMEDQGWIAWFIIAIVTGKNITIYGDGKQVRDVLYVEDLVKAYYMAIKNIHRTRGQVYNIGGGGKFSISIWKDFKPILEKLFKRKIKVKFAKERPGDQKIYISDISKAKKDFSWQPTVNPKEGIEKLYKWITLNKNIFTN